MCGECHACFIQTTRLSNVQRYTVQCELRINEYVEVSLLLLWLWLWWTIILLLLSATFRTVKVLVLPKHYALRRMRGMLPQAPDDDGARAELTALWLTPDGALLLELLEHNVSMNAASAVVTATVTQANVTNRSDMTTAPASTMRIEPVHATRQVAPSSPQHQATPQNAARREDAMPLMEYKP